MKKIITAFALILLTYSTNAQYQVNRNPKGDNYYLNPIFAGDYPDPSLLRDGSDYYIVHSSFEYYPGLLIWHSKDLINWTPVTHALHKYVGSVWAPDLVKYKNKYYIYFPAGKTTYVVTAGAINGPWSNPVDLKSITSIPGILQTPRAGAICILIMEDMSLCLTMASQLPVSLNMRMTAGKYPGNGRLNVSAWKVPKWLNGTISTTSQLLKVEQPDQPPVTW